MKLESSFDLYIPSGSNEEIALERTTHLAIGAHPDDLEIMAYHGIYQCYENTTQWFTGVVVCDGAGSSRSGAFATKSDEEMIEIRRLEQRRAAEIGRYSAVLQLGYSSAAVRASNKDTVRKDLVELLKATKPRFLYVHNPADKHDTHVAVFWRTIEALRELPREFQPERVWGCEIWRDLDWLGDEEKVVLPTSQNPGLALSLISVFDSQVSGGKRYDLATMGRRQANATFSEARAADQERSVTFAMNLTPLLSPDVDPLAYVSGAISRMKSDVLDRMERLR